MILQPQAGEIRQFVDYLFRYADPGTFVSLRAFDQVDRACPPVLIEGIAVGADFVAIVARATAAAGKAANGKAPAVFAPPIATFVDARRARSVDVANGIALSVEIDEGNAEAARAKLVHLLGPATIVVASGGEWADPATGELLPKLHLHWRLAEPTREPADHAKLREARWLAAVLVGGDRTAAPPAHPLRWPGSWNCKRAPRLARIASGNAASEIHLEDALDLLASAVEGAGLRRSGPGPHIGGIAEAPIADLAAALAAIPNSGGLHWDDWNRLGMATWRATGGSEAGLDAWAAWSAKSPKHDGQACADRWQHFGISPPARIGAGTVFYLAALAGWQRMRRPEAAEEPPDFALGAEAYSPPPRSDRQQPGARQAPAARLWSSADEWDEASLPRRPWILPGYVMRGAVTIFAGMPGGGKSSLMCGIAAASSLGEIYGRFAPAGKLRVLVYNVEDDSDEQKRRLSATLRQFDARPADMGGRLLRVGPEDVGTLIEHDAASGAFALTEAWAELERLVLDFRPDIIVLDPLAEIHSADENANTALRHVVALLRAWAKRHGCGVVLVHHARKGGMAGDPDAIRGAGSIVGAVRIAATIAPMTEDEAGEMGIRPALRRYFFRVDNVKSNYGPPSEAEWFQLIGYQLDNGEEIAAALPWAPPSAQAGAGAALDAWALVCSAVERGTPSGPFSPRLATTEIRSIAPLLARHGIEAIAAQRIAVSRLLAEGFSSVEYRDAASRKTRTGLRSVAGLPVALWADREGAAEC